MNISDSLNKLPYKYILGNEIATDWYNFTKPIDELKEACPLECEIQFDKNKFRLKRKL